jgi:hypothetical protein
MNIHALGGIRTRDPSNRGGALDRKATGIVAFLLMPSSLLFSNYSSVRHIK